jgi:flagellar motor switch protein FliM
MVILFQIRIRDLDFSFKVCFPYFVLESVLKKLNMQGWTALMQRKQAEGDAECIESSLRRTQMPVSVCLGREKLLIRDFIDLQVGDVIRLDRNIQESLDVIVKGKPTFHAKPGQYGSRKAVRIVGMIEEENRDE